MENNYKNEKGIKYKNSFASSDTKEIGTLFVALSMTAMRLAVGLVQ